jgi:hypothetical protein
MVLVHPVAARDELEPEPAVRRERVQHVREEVDVGLDADRPAVEVELQLDAGFLRLPRDACDASYG